MELPEIESISNYHRTESDRDIEALRTRNLRMPSSTVNCPTKKSVGFASIDIRRHSIVIGDHPCCTMGCPLSLGWDYSDAVAQTLEQYEATRSPRRTRRDLRTSHEERRAMLADEHSDGEIRRAARKLHRERSCSARVCERVSESFFREQQCEHLNAVPVP
jgi:hypothetical protein